MQYLNATIVTGIPQQLARDDAIFKCNDNILRYRCTVAGGLSYNYCDYYCTFASVVTEGWIRSFFFWQQSVCSNISLSLFHFCLRSLRRGRRLSRPRDSKHRVTIRCTPSTDEIKKKKRPRSSSHKYGRPAKTRVTR